MGILNVTPDSFYDGGKYNNRERALARAAAIAEEGGGIIDIGGESTRPGAEPVSAQEEMDRICSVIEDVVKETGLPVSIDTTKSPVAEAAARVGAQIINDISGGLFDPDILDVAAKHNIYIVLTHFAGQPFDIHGKVLYTDFLDEMKISLARSCCAALEKGIKSDNIILDPGIGFGKSLEENYKIIGGVAELKKIGYPLLIGLSRKSLIGKLYSQEEDRLSATIALNSVAVYAGADIIRVHDVKAHTLAMQALSKLREVL